MDTDDEWVDLDPERSNTPADEEEDDLDEAEALELLAKVVPTDTCLFCDKKSPNIKANVKHMDLYHGFFIPEEQYLIDLKGLIEYLGFKVGAGATCLWCDKQFTSLHGVRLHMLYKDHCKIQYDQEKAAEYKEFYDYSGQIQIPMKPLSELAIPKKRFERRALIREKNQSKLCARNSGTVAIAEPGKLRQEKTISKFNAQHAKRVLRIGMTNNNAVRGRLRRQNPM
jgi:hypothetical protein